MKNVIILNLKSVFLPDHIMQSEENSHFISYNSNSINSISSVIPYFDRFAVNEINRIVELTDAEIVISDGWFWTENFDRTKTWCAANGLKINFHHNWMTPKAMSSYRINEIQWWIEQNKDDNLILILDEDYSLKNLLAAINHSEFMQKQYDEKYSKYLGKKRRKSLIPALEYLKYEEAKVTHEIDVNRIVNINEEIGLTLENIEESWLKINTYKK